MTKLQIIYAAVVGLCAIASCVIFKPYTSASYPGKSRMTLYMKMTLSTLFIVIAVMSALIAGQFSRFTVLMFFGFGFSWVGDLLLGLGSQNKIFLSGTLGFLTAHVFYIAGMASAKDAPSFFEPVTLTVLAATLTAGFVLCVKKKARFGKLLVPMSVYFTVLSLMLAKAVSLSVHMQPGRPGALVLPVGAALFVCSDVTLGMMRFRMHKPGRAFRVFSTVSYFIAQMFVAASLAFIW